MNVRRGGRRAVGTLLGICGLFALAGGPAIAGGTQARGDTGVRDASGGSTSAQTEQTIAVDPTNPNNVLIGSISGLSVSHDGGLTWSSATPSCSGDNNPTFDRSGVAYFECDNNGVEYYRSTDAGDHWTGPLSAVGFFESNGDLVDRPWLVQGVGASGLVVGWESFFTTPVGSVHLKVSSDGGATWGSPHRVDDPNDHPAMQDPRQVPVVGADGTIYVAYASGNGPFLDCRNCLGLLPTDYIVARSSDSGATFQRTVAAPNISRTASPDEESEAISSLAADPNPARARHLALAWADQRSGESRILVVTSMDGGVTWSSPTDVADDPPGTGIQHDHPQVAFAPDGRLIVVWRDGRCCGTAWTTGYQIFARPLTIADSGTIVPGLPVQVTDGPQQHNASSSADEYLGLSVGREGVSVAWNQPRNGAAGATYRRIPIVSVGAVTLSWPSMNAAGPFTNETLSANATGFVVTDSSPLTYHYQWSRNGVDLTGQTGPTLDLSPGGIGDEGDVMTVRVYVTDPGALSSADASASVTVQDAPPLAGTVTLTWPDQRAHGPFFDQTLTATPSGFSDLDNDPLTYHFQWSKDGVDLAGETGSTLNLATAGILRHGEVISVRAWATEPGGLASANVSASATMQN